MSSEPDERKKFLHSELGNFMILDSEENNNKGNKPLIEAINYYKKMNSWLIEDIENMIKDDDYFDSIAKIPKEAFFKARSERLKTYFISILDRGFDDESVKISFTKSR